MKADTRLFGKIDVADDNVIKIKEGIIGYPNFVNFTLIHDEEKKKKGGIRWLQSLDDGAFALPVVDPLEIVPEYKPTVGKEALKLLGDMPTESAFILVTITVPKEIEQMSVNLKAPFIINMENLQGVQLIIEDNYPVKYKIYDILQKKKAGGQTC